MCVKECYQIKYPDLTTPCFGFVGNTPCSAPTCAVEIELNEIEAEAARRKIEIDYERGVPDVVSLLLHLKCRLSSSSRNNQEFRDRRRSSHLSLTPSR